MFTDGAGVEYDKNTDVVYIAKTKNVKKQDIVVFNINGLNLKSSTLKKDSLLIKSLFYYPCLELSSPVLTYINPLRYIYTNI